MRPKVKRLAESLSAAVAAWDCVECITLGEHSENDTLDPYFALVLDVYHRGPVPPSEERQAAYAKASSDPGAFESAVAQAKDRFFIEGLPIRVEYKSVASIEEILVRGLEVVWVLKNSGTYRFYRLQNSQILFRRSDWIDGIRSSLLELRPEFWEALREAFVAKMEHFLSDLGAAALRDDGFFYLESAAGFARYTAAALFMANRRFEPSHRLIDAQLRSLDRLPESFRGRWETFLRSDLDLSRKQHYEVAQLIARSVINLS